MHPSLIMRILKTTAVRAIMAVNKVGTIRVVVPSTASGAIGAVLFVGAVGTGRQVTTVRAVCPKSVKACWQHR